MDYLPLEKKAVQTIEGEQWRVPRKGEARLNRKARFVWCDPREESL